MARAAAALAAGVSFGLGLALSGMIDPAKVLAFLDLAGAWDASLALVMAGALAVTAPAYRLVLRRRAPLLADAFRLPTRREIDGNLVAGALLFGVGWGVGGFCPGPALAALAFGDVKVIVFVAAMAVGALLARWWPGR